MVVQPSRDRGSIGIVVVVASMVMLIAIVAGIGVATEAMVHRQRAQTAADAAALAGVTDGQAAAVQLAVANGGELVAWVDAGGEVIVTVRYRSQTARARATDRP